MLLLMWHTEIMRIGGKKEHAGTAWFTYSAHSFRSLMIEPPYRKDSNLAIVMQTHLMNQTWSR